MQESLRMWGMRLLFADSLADGTILSRPLLSAALLLAAYSLWLPFGALWSLAAHIISTPAVTILSLALTVFAGRLLAYSMVFPASFEMAAHSMHREYAHRLRADVIRGCQAPVARLLSLASLQRRAAAVSGYDAQPLSLPPSLASALLSGSPDAPLAAALSVTPDESITAQPGQYGALNQDGFIATLEALALEPADKGQEGGFGLLSLHGALLLHYAVAGRELTRCIEASVANALRVPYSARDRAGVKAGSARILTVQVGWVPSNESASRQADDLISGEHCVSPDCILQLRALFSTSVTDTLLSPTPPCPAPGQSVLAVRQALAAGQGNGLPLTVRQAMLAALACYARVRVLSVWGETVPYNGIGGGRACREVAKAARPVLPHDEVTACVHALSSAWWRARLPSALADRLGCVAPSPVQPASAGTPAGPPIGALLGLPDECVMAAKELLDAALSGLSLPVPRDAMDDEQGEGARAADTTPHPAAPRMLPLQGQASTSAQTGIASESSEPVTAVSAVFRQVGSALSIVLDKLWYALTVSRNPLPVLGPDFLRMELRLRACGRQVWIRSSNKHMVDAMVIPSPATCLSWRAGGPPLGAAGQLTVPISLPHAAHGAEVDPFASLVPPALESPAASVVTLRTGQTSSDVDNGGTIRLCAPVVVILCAPNAGMLEHCLRHNDWVAVYGGGRIGSTTLTVPDSTSSVPAPGDCLKADVLLWNYRGVVRCQGKSPSMTGMHDDVRAVVEWAKAHAGPDTRIVVHGESLGGLASCWVASQPGLAHVVLSDRTFSSLPTVAARLMGKWADIGLRGLTGWTESNTTAWMAMPSMPRLLLVDPEDSVISWDVSLAQDIALSRITAKETKVRTKKGVVGFAGTVGRATISAGSYVLTSARDCVSSIVKRAARARDHPDHNSDAPETNEGERAEAEPVQDADNTSHIGEAAPSQGDGGESGIDVASAAALSREFMATTAQLHYLLLHLSRVTAIVFARQQASAMPGSTPNPGAMHGAPITSFPLPPLDAAPGSAPPTSPAPADSALTSVMKRRGADLPRSSFAFACFVDEAYGKLDGTWREISATVAVTASAMCSRAEGILSAQLGTTVQVDSAEFSMRMQVAIGCGALAAVLAGTSNGVGSTLAEACAPGISQGPEDGLRCTRSWVAAGLVWGWATQTGRGPVAELASLLPRPAGYPLVGALDAPCAALARAVPYLEAAHESGLDTLQRRLQALRGAALAGVTGPATPAGQTSVFTVPAEVRLIDEALVVAASLQKLRGRWQAMQDPRSATAAGALCTSEGVCIPITCGHNAALSRREVQIVLSGVHAALKVRTQ